MKKCDLGFGKLRKKRKNDEDKVRKIKVDVLET